MEPDQSCIIPIQLVIAVDDVNGDPLRFVTPALAEAIQELNHNNPHPDNRPDQPHLNNGNTETAQPEPASDYFQPLERALQELDNHNHNDIQPVENTLLQEIENHDIPPLENPLPPIDPHDIQSRRRDRFGNLEFRQTFKVPPIANVGDLAQFYEDVLNHFNALAERVRPEVRPNDLVQVEIIAENAQEHDIIQVGDTGVDFQNVFEGLLERLIQSNRELDADSPLEVVIQVVKNPRGGAGDKRKLKKTLVSEIVNKKKKHLHVVPNVNNKLCFTISLALLINTDFTYIQAVEHARELHHLAGLTGPPPHDICPMTGIAFEEMHSASQEKLHQLRSTHGLHTEVMTEHAWTLMKKTHAGVREFMKKYDPPEPLAPRAALYGGRTSALRLRCGQSASFKKDCFCPVRPRDQGLPPRLNNLQTVLRDHHHIQQPSSQPTNHSRQTLLGHPASQPITASRRFWAIQPADQSQPAGISGLASANQSQQADVSGPASSSPTLSPGLNSLLSSSNDDIEANATLLYDKEEQGRWRAAEKRQQAGFRITPQEISFEGNPVI
ncbi:uncharacterized protein LOC120575328 [Perca fluviatilis]|uniref:uncharacterized protein LOC120575328 n=1 Tax=Perca fluviatilis TaxID=8168 RepID=UPI001964736F|nr:uncharacterized protein LOC120575328 [Perca fluviatilis]